MVNLLSRLKIGKKLGSGAFGDVFLGDDEVHGQVAVKVLSRESHWSDSTWDSWCASFLAEAQNLSKASHKHVVQVHYMVAADDGESIKICMKFCPGGSLQAPYESGPIEVETVRKIGSDVLMGLAALHSRGLIHRDIKPANILRDNRKNALIADFGFVTDEMIFGYATAAGYWDHLAYEVWHGKGTSIKSDIWAFGATLYRLLHGKLWYEEAPEPKHIIKSGGYADGLKWLPHIPKSWRRVVRQMLKDDTKKRYQNADQALSALSNLPVAKPWKVDTQPHKIRWEMKTATRLNIVEWRRVPRKNEWLAWSEPLKSGRRMTLGGSKGIISAKQAMSELEKYFSA